MMGLNHNSKLPRFTVSSADLGRVSNMADSLNLRDERSVATRMESVELSMRHLGGLSGAQGAFFLPNALVDWI